MYSSYICKEKVILKVRGMGIRTTFRNSTLYLHIALTAFAIGHFAEGDGIVILCWVHDVEPEIEITFLCLSILDYFVKI
jgi:hypothetical protein